jgi:hypothetical protein
MAAASVAATASSSAHAVEFDVTGDTTFQAYEVTDPWGDVIVARRRFTQTLGLAAYDLQGQHHAGEADYRLVLRLRLDSDFGINANLPPQQAGGETHYATPGGNGIRFIPGLQSNPLDVMYGYVEGRNIAHGLLGFRIGRQYMTDALGWWSFDGGLVRITTPYYVQLEAFGGLEQRGGLPLSTSRFEPHGIWRGSHSGFGVGADQPSVVNYPSYIYTEPAPAFGFAAESVGPSFVHARLSYRRVYNTGTALTTQFPEPGLGGYHTVDGLRISQDRVGFAADASKADLGGVTGAFSYDLYSQIVSSYRAGLEGHLGKRVTLGADIDYFVPTFDADSIWNWFTRSPITTLSARAVARFTKRFDISASGGARLWTVDGDPSLDPKGSGFSVFGARECGAASAAVTKANMPAGYRLDCTAGNVFVDPSADPVKGVARDPANRALTTTVDALGNLAGRYRFGAGEVSLRGMFETGARGSREGVDVSGEGRLDGGRYLVGGHVSVYGWADPLRPDRDAVSFAYVLAAGFRPVRFGNLRVEWEHDMNRLVGQRFRVVGLVTLVGLK